LGINLEEAKEAITAHESTFVELPEINYYDTNYHELDILLSKLPSRYAEIIKLIYLEEYTITQIKNMLNLSFYQIKQLEEEGLKLLKNIADGTINCPKCFSKQIIKNGKRTAKQQYLCKECGYQFTKDAAPTGRPGHDDTIKIAVLTAIQNGKSFAWCETYLNICKSTAYAWTQQYIIVDNKLIKKSMTKD
jgi:transposase-like protein